MMFQRTNSNESLILAQNQRWRRASDMQVERESFLRETLMVTVVKAGDRKTSRLKRSLRRIS